MGKIKRYCIATGCKNNDQNSDCTFFAIPSGKTEDYIERCEKWLTLLGREDLLQKKDLKKHHYLVCCAHFDSSSIKLTKTLVKNAIPSLLLSNQPDEEPSSSAAHPESTFKDEITSSKSTQTETSSSLAKGTPKRKLEDEKNERKQRRLSDEITVIKEEIEIKIEPITCDDAKDELEGY